MSEGREPEGKGQVVSLWRRRPGGTYATRTGSDRRKEASHAV